MNSQNQQTQQKGKRLTKKQALILMIVGLSISFICSKFLNYDNFLGATIGTMVNVVIIFSIVSLLTKKGLRWK